MSDKFNEIIQDITLKHGVVLGKDDPILILHTMNERLLEENRKAQQEIVAQFKAEIEHISSRWKDDAKEKAAKIVNAALASSKETMVRSAQEWSNEAVQTMTKILSNSLVEARELTQQTRKFSWFALLSSIAILFGTCLILLLGS